MPTQKPFYGNHTEKKLQALGQYMERYLTVLSKQAFETVYVDAFAGSGQLPQGDRGNLFPEETDSEEFVRGSALRALEQPRKFSRYIFIEKKKGVLEELKERASRCGVAADKIEFIKGEAGEMIKGLVPLMSKSSVRALVFLDPFGNQVSWQTLEALAKTKHVDLWYLFPAMLGVYRQLQGNDDEDVANKQASLDRLFGPHDWRKAFVTETTVTDLFGNPEVERKIVNVEDITRFKIACMNKIFEGGVLEKWLPLGRDGAHWYSLIFAMANPNQNAKNIGHSIAKHIMTNS